jgi:hypothetical protein
MARSSVRMRRDFRSGELHFFDCDAIASVAPVDSTLRCAVTRFVAELVAPYSSNGHRPPTFAERIFGSLHFFFASPAAPPVDADTDQRRASEHPRDDAQPVAPHELLAGRPPSSLLHLSCLAPQAQTWPDPKICRGVSTICRRHGRREPISAGIQGHFVRTTIVMVPSPGRRTGLRYLSSNG